MHSLLAKSCEVLPELVELTGDCWRLFLLEVQAKEADAAKVAAAQRPSQNWKGEVE